SHDACFSPLKSCPPVKIERRDGGKVSCREGRKNASSRGGGVLIVGPLTLPSPPLRGRGEEKESEVGAEGVGDVDGAVGALVVFHDGDEGAADGDAGAIEGVDQLGFAGGGVAPAGLHAAGLKILAIAAGGNFTIFVLAGEPDFDVVGLGRGKPH